MSDPLHRHPARGGTADASEQRIRALDSRRRSSDLPRHPLMFEEAHGSARSSSPSRTGTGPTLHRPRCWNTCCRFRTARRSCSSSRAAPNHKGRPSRSGSRPRRKGIRRYSTRAFSSSCRCRWPTPCSWRNVCSEAARCRRTCATCCSGAQAVTRSTSASWCARYWRPSASNATRSVAGARRRSSPPATRHDRGPDLARIDRLDDEAKRAEGRRSRRADVLYCVLKAVTEAGSILTLTSIDCAGRADRRKALARAEYVFKHPDPTGHVQQPARRPEATDASASRAVHRAAVRGQAGAVPRDAGASLRERTTREDARYLFRRRIRLTGQADEEALSCTTPSSHAERSPL